MSNPPNVNYIKASMVLNYLARDEQINALLGPDEVTVTKKGGEAFLFPQAVIDVLEAIGAAGKDPTTMTKDAILSYARAVMIGEAAAETPVEPPAEAAAVEVETEAPPPPPPAPKPAPRPAVRTRTPPPRPPAPAVAAPPVTVAPATPPVPEVVRLSPVAVTPPVAAVPVPVAVPVAAPAEPTAQHLKQSAGYVIFHLVAGAHKFAVEHDTAPGFEARRQRLKQLFEDYIVFVN
jgi:hypothetical protein